MTLDELGTRPLDIATCSADDLIAEIDRQKLELEHRRVLAVEEQNQLLSDIRDRLRRVDVRQDEQAVMLTDIKSMLEKFGVGA